MRPNALLNYYKKLVFGDSTSYDLQKRIFLLITHITLIIGLIGVVTDIVLGLDTLLILITVAAVLIVLFFHIRVKQTQFNIKFAVGIFILSLFALSFLWIYNGGYNGNNSVLIFVYFIVMITILPARLRMMSFIVYSIVIIGLISYQYFYPQSIVAYQSEYQRYIDLTTGYILYLILGYNIQNTIIKNYEIEHEIVKIKNDQLNDLNKRLNNANHELAESTKRVEEINSSKDRFITLISHDLRAPFHGLLGITKELEDEYDSYSDKEKIMLLKQVSNSVQRVYSLLEELLLWSKVQRNAIVLSREKVNLNNLLEESISFFSETAVKKKISIHLNCDQEIELMLDEEMISAVIRNLISNAIKFSPIGGAVTIKANKDIDSAVISIIDEGVGIPKELLIKLFHIEELFSTTGTSGEQGSGMGSIICKDILDKHDGKIYVESIEGKGSTFKIQLPYNIV